MAIVVKRVYEPAEPDDGYRVLVDRLWPRGLSKQRAKVDLWLKEVAPSTALREWFHHERPKWAEFQSRYRAELDQNPSVDELRAVLAEHDRVTLLFGARDAEENQAVALRDYLD